MDAARLTKDEARFLDEIALAMTQDIKPVDLFHLYRVRGIPESAFCWVLFSYTAARGDLELLGRLRLPDNVYALSNACRHAQLNRNSKVLAFLRAAA